MPEATMPTMMLVVVEDDWTSTVKRTPNMTPTMGLRRSSESAKTCEEGEHHQKCKLHPSSTT
jgi:hypothetical protein